MGLDAELKERSNEPAPSSGGAQDAIGCGEHIHVEIVRVNVGDSEDAE